MNKYTDTRKTIEIKEEPKTAKKLSEESFKEILEKTQLKNTLLSFSMQKSSSSSQILKSTKNTNGTVSLLNVKEKDKKKNEEKEKKVEKEKSEEKKFKALPLIGSETRRLKKSASFISAATPKQSLTNPFFLNNKLLNNGNVFSSLIRKHRPLKNFNFTKNKIHFLKKSTRNLNIQNPVDNAPVNNANYNTNNKFLNIYLK